MADKSIIELQRVDQLQVDSSIPVYQDGTAKRVTGDQIADFARNQVSEYAESAQQSASSAEQSAQQVAEKVEEVQSVSANPPKIQNGNWWVYNPSTKKYEDSGYDASLSFQIGSVITGEAGSEAIIENVGTESDVILNMTIPRGEPGDATSDISGYTKAIGISAMDQKSNGTVLSINNIQGNTVLGGTPSYDAPASMTSVESSIDLRIAGANLIPPSILQYQGTTTVQGVTIEGSGGVFKLSGTYTGSTDGYIHLFDFNKAPYFALPAGQYRFSLSPDSELSDYVFISLSDRTTGSFVGKATLSKTVTSKNFTLNADMVESSLQIVLQPGFSTDGITIAPQISAGTEEVAYEAPSCQIIGIPLIGKDGQPLEPLRMAYAGTYGENKTLYADRILRKNGVWYIERNIEEFDFTDAKWTKGTSYMTPYLNGYSIQPGVPSNYPLCTHFSARENLGSQSAGIWIGMRMVVGNEVLPNGADTTIDEMQQFCAAQAEAGTPVLICTPMSPPIYEELHQDIQVLLNTLSVPGGTCSVWFSGEIPPSSADIGIPRGDFPSENARALAMTRADRTLSNLSDYQKALHNIGGRPNYNFAPNWYFAGGGSQLGYGIFPINQRGKTEYSTDHAYGIDGWISVGGYKITKNGLLINTGGIAYAKLDPNEIAPLIGETCTASVLYANGNLISGTFLYAGIDAQNTIKDDSELGFWIGHVDGFVLNYPTITIQQKTDMGEIVAIKLELGDKQTLCYKDASGDLKLFETPNFGEELKKCQRYLFPVESNGCWGYADGNGIVYLQVSTPVSMKTKPVWSGTLPRLYPNDGNSVSSVSVLSCAPNNIVLFVSGSNFTKGKVYSANEISGFLSSEL